MARHTKGVASDLATNSATGATVNIDAANPPTPGQILKATDATTAIWQNETGGSGVSQTVLGSWDFDTATDASDPGAGEFKFDQGIITNVTNIYIDDVSQETGLISSMFPVLGAGDYISFRSSVDSHYAVFQLTGIPTDNTGWWTIPVTQAAFAGSFAAGELCNAAIVINNVSLSGSGAPGTGTGNGYRLGTVYVDTTADTHYSLVDNTTDSNVWDSGGSGTDFRAGYGEWLYDSTSTSGVGITSGDFRLNNANPSTATKLYLADTNNEGRDFSTLGGNLNAGDVVVLNNDGGTESVIYTVAIATNQAGYWEYDVSAANGDTSFTNNGTFNLVHVPVDKWLSGSGAPGASTGNGYAIGTPYIDTATDEAYFLADNAFGSNVWTSSTGGGGATDLDSLTDVTLTTPSTDAILIKTAGDWVDGTVNTNSITDDAVTYTKIQNVAADNVVLGNNSGAGGVVSELALSNGALSYDTTGGTFSQAQFQNLAQDTLDNLEAATSDVTQFYTNNSDEFGALGEKAAPENTDRILIEDNTGATWAKKYIEVQDLPGGGATDLDSLTDVTLTTPSTDAILIKTAGDWVDGTVNTNSITNDAVTYAKIQNVVADNVVLGNNAGAGGVVDELTGAEVADLVTPSLSHKNSVRAATIVAGTLASSFENGDAIDGVTLATNDRILIKNQATASENGIYIVQATGAPSRASDYASSSSAASTIIPVEEGTENADTQWTCTNNSGSDVVGTNNLVFQKAVTLANLGSGTLTDLNSVVSNATVQSMEAGEINALTSKASPVGADVLIIEDSASSYGKKKVLVSNLPAGSEINDLVTDGISGIADDQLAVGTGAGTAGYQTLSNGAVSYDTTGGTFSQAQFQDLASDTLANLTTATSDVTQFYTNNSDEFSALGEKAAPENTDRILIEDNTGATWAKKYIEIQDLPGGASSLDGLSDVTLTTPATDAILIKTAGDWVDGTINTDSITDDAVTYTKLQNVVGDGVFLGNNSGAGAVVDELTGTEATALLDTFSTSDTTKGLVPGSSGAAATVFLNATGNWSTPAGGGDVSFQSGTVTDNQITRYHLTTGTLIQGGINQPSIDDSGNIALVGTNTVDGVDVSELSDIANMAQNTIAGRVTASTGAPEELTSAQATGILDQFATDSTTQGVVPGSNSLGATYYLDGSGTWSEPTPDVETVVATAIKSSAGTINDNQLVYVVGWDIGNSCITVEAADNSSSSTMPAYGIAQESFTNVATGQITISGDHFYGDTTTIAGAGDGDGVYVGTSGALTGTKPTGTALVQKFGILTYDNASNGRITVVGAGRSNDLPNIADDSIWVGSATGVPTATAVTNGALAYNTGTNAFAQANFSDLGTKTHTHADAANGGTLGTTALDDDAVTLAKIDAHTGAVAGVLGYGASGNPAEISAGATNDYALTSNGTGSAPSFKQLQTASYADNSVTDEKLEDMAGFSLKAKVDTGTGDPADLTVSDNTVVGRAGGNVVSAQLVNAQITDDTIANGKLANMNANTVKVNATAGSANPTDLALSTNQYVVRKSGNIVAAAIPRHVKSITVEDPAATEDIAMFYTNVAITVTQITAVIVGSTSVTFNISHGTSRATVTNDVMQTDDVADSTTTGNITTDFTGGDPSIPADSFVALTVSNRSGTPAELHVSVEYTED